MVNKILLLTALLPTASIASEFIQCNEIEPTIPGMGERHSFVINENSIGHGWLSSMTEYEIVEKNESGYGGILKKSDGGYSRTLSISFRRFGNINDDRVTHILIYGSTNDKGVVTVASTDLLSCGN
ncbi:hypothetical protein GT360_15745 [Vibrio astriarenae]|uniref:Uncharacterized protein n=1 Tax=Vibrio astriarenae TaxID=1481923 RepID=A0A7Z2YFD4_9VIBR|nr:hypothetical protein [Vibrio astriarenae]QIA65015.1 hypothetical protein GT360_15745 [Vibrio astriarenae]